MESRESISTLRTLNCWAQFSAPGQTNAGSWEPVSRCTRYLDQGGWDQVHSSDLISPILTGLSGEPALLLHQQRGRRGRPTRTPWRPLRERCRPERPALQVQLEIRRGWRHCLLHLSLRDEHPRPHVDLGPPALPLRSEPREVPMGGSLPSGSPLHMPGDEVLESYC